MVCFESVGPDTTWKHTVGPHKRGVSILQRARASILADCPRKIPPAPYGERPRRAFLRVKDLEYGTNIALGARVAEVLTCAGDFQPWQRSVLSEDFLA